MNRANRLAWTLASERERQGEEGECEEGADGEGLREGTRVPRKRRSRSPDVAFAFKDGKLSDLPEAVCSAQPLPQYTKVSDVNISTGVTESHLTSLR